LIPSAPRPLDGSIVHHNLSPRDGSPFSFTEGLYQNCICTVYIYIYGTDIRSALCKCCIVGFYKGASVLAVMGRTYDILIHLLTYFLTSWSRVLEKLTGFQLVEKFPAFYGNRKSITAFTSAHHQSLYNIWYSYMALFMY